MRITIDIPNELVVAMRVRISRLRSKGVRRYDQIVTPALQKELEPELKQMGFTSKSSNL